MKRNKLLTTVAGVATLAITLTACGNKAPEQGDDTKKPEGDLNNKATEVIKAEDASKNPEAAKNRKDTIVIGIDKPEGVFNPAYYESVYDRYVADAMFAYIADIKHDGKLEDGLGSVKLSEDGLTYTITLKDGVKWSDGTPITTDDLEFSFFVKSDKAYDGPSDYSSLKIKGWAAYHDGTSDKIEGLEKVDAKTLKVTLEEVNVSAIYDIGNFQPIPKEFYGKHYKQGEADKLQSVHRTPELFSGPYKLKEYKEGQSITLEANENYYKGKAKIPNLIYKVTNKNTAMQLLETGEVDINALTVSTENVSQIKTKGFLDQHIYPTNGYGYVAFNHRKEALKDVKVRQAIAYALNRKAITDTVYKGYADVINIPQTRVSSAYTDDVEKYEFDKEKANSLLDEAGWKKGSDGIREKDGKKLSLKFLASTPNEVNDALLNIAVGDFKEVGIDFKAEQMDFDTIRTKTKQEDGDYDMYFMAWGLTPDPDSSTIFKTGGSQNKIGYSNAKVDEFLTKGLKATNQADRDKIYQDMYKELNKDLPYIFVYQRRDMWVVNSRIKNVDVSPYREFTTDLAKYEIEQ
ncbi:ABC transporter substrate-binding protein [Clostridium algidicarnis]|uniref:ABC transporter substrate-binding protein n=1 Tax=Clostridium algidicarnis TaxID=37659 RepID=UPI001C0ACB4F|nr:ABC transporter substrate-binding protein [Clostridium algidicarnis]MBU3204547.1 peptide ABC transporter substrate-binding protein [Clostridium algidicarnis]MBU3212369.1 peptide ABC transporter substrate-binding protein [Clostridium algidicarnis]MBU3222801.1 peptide ABC transporter substrate-binding protein [Clostridium algidicarnis]